MKHLWKLILLIAALMLVAACGNNCGNGYYYNGQCGYYPNTYAQPYYGGYPGGYPGGYGGYPGGYPAGYPMH